MTWSSSDIPDLTGLSIIVTGANSGIGLEAARALAANGAAVTLAVRDVARGASAAEHIRAAAPGAQVEVARLDLADLASVHEFADGWRAAHPDGLDVLVNNAGVMAIPRRETADGFEMQLGTNHLGHFALTGLLIGAVRPGGRVVTVSSGAHRFGRMDFEDLQSAESYQKWRAYGQSKLANILFALELHRRAGDAGVDVRSIAVHPGYAATNLQSVGPQMSGSRVGVAMMSLVNRVVAQSAEAGGGMAHADGSHRPERSERHLHRSDGVQGRPWYTRLRDTLGGRPGRGIGPPPLGCEHRADGRLLPLVSTSLRPPGDFVNGWAVG